MVEDPAASFSRARSAAGALFFDDQDRVLLLEPTYKDHWDVPGGYVEEGETPSQACSREVAEELGLHVRFHRPLAIDWAPSAADGDKILFVFDGGVLESDQLAQVVLDPGEIASYEFVDLADAVDRLIPRLARRLNAAVEARHTNHVVYLEHGRPLS